MGKPTSLRSKEIRVRVQASGDLQPGGGAGPRMGNEEKEASGEMGILAEVWPPWG